MVWITLVASRIRSLKGVLDLMHDINGISHEWSICADRVLLSDGDAVLICRYSGSSSYAAGRTELARMLDERDWTDVKIDDDASRTVNRLDGAVA